MLEVDKYSDEGCSFAFGGRIGSESDTGVEFRYKTFESVHMKIAFTDAINKQQVNFK